MRTVAGMSVVVTGAGSGIGEGVARRFVASGARVTVSGRRAERVQILAEDLGDACRPVPGDVTVSEDRSRLVAAAVDHGGGIDVLVHAAGNMYRGPVNELDEQRLLEVYHSNTVGPMMLTGLALPHLVARRGAVVFFGSVHTVRAFPGASPYAATKGALETLTGVLAAELGPQGVRVNCVRPGGVLTEINDRAGVVSEPGAAAERLAGLAAAHALGRIGTVEEVAEAVEHLVAADWTTGTVMTVDGGLALGVTQG